MKVVIAGGTGFIGERLATELAEDGDVVVLSRNPSRVRVGRGVGWSDGDWKEEVATADAVVNLAGESVAGGRWTAGRKRALVESRIRTTDRLVEALHDAGRPEIVLVSASAVGYYGSRGDECLDEDSKPGSGFLAELARSWEESAGGAIGVARVVILRIGMVLDRHGGALAKMLLPFRLGVGGRLGRGDQWMSWIDGRDLIRMIRWALETPSCRGVYNATAPEPVTNREFTRSLARAIHRPAVIPVPVFALRLALGEMADQMLIAGQRVVPRRATEEGFRFEHPSLDDSFQRTFAR